MTTLVDLEVQRLLREAYQLARTVLSEHFHQLDCLAQALIEYEQLDRAAFKWIVQQEIAKPDCSTPPGVSLAQTTSMG